jgi:hypothetical protein
VVGAAAGGQGEGGQGAGKARGLRMHRVRQAANETPTSLRSRYADTR